MRALLIINPRATAMTGRDAGLVVRVLGAQLELDTRQTQYRGHAGKLAAASAAEGYDLVLPFSGDGTVNEVVNGLMQVPDPADRPAIAPIPGGSANVFARTLGLPPDAGEAAQRVLAAVKAGERRKIGLGLADDRYFTFSAGLGVDAEVVGDMERQRARGRRASVAAYLRTAVRRYYGTDRSRPALTLRVPGRPSVHHLFMGVVTNSSPWTYLGNRAVRPAHADFSSGLDLFALRRLRTLTSLAALGHMMHSDNEELPSGRDVVSASALSELAFEADRPIAYHIDGEYLGETKSVVFRFVPDALCVVALRNPNAPRLFVRADIRRYGGRPGSCHRARGFGGYGGSPPRGDTAGLRARYDGGSCHRARNPVTDLTLISCHLFAAPSCADSALLRG